MKAFLVLIALLWAAYTVRLHMVLSQIRRRLSDRLSVGERDARVMHDALLQGVQGLILQFQSAADQGSFGPPQRNAVDRALDRAEEVLLASRLSVQDLRTASAAGDVSGLLAEIVRRQMFPSETEVRLSVAGTERTLDPCTLDEVAKISEEVLFSARRQTTAQVIDVVVTFGRHDFSVMIRDDGNEVDPRLRSTGREGRFGLASISQRARTLGARLTIVSELPAGTEVVIKVPARTAYARRHSNVIRWRSTLRGIGLLP